jgi:hypothetical protein
MDLARAPLMQASIVHDPGAANGCSHSSTTTSSATT